MHVCAVRHVTATTDVSCAVGLAGGGRRSGEAGHSGSAPCGAAQRSHVGENTCARATPQLQEGKTALTPRLQIKQYLWAIVIKGKFESVLTLHYARLCAVRLGCCSWLNGTGGYRGRERQPRAVLLQHLVLSGRELFSDLPSPGNFFPSLPLKGSL